MLEIREMQQPALRSTALGSCPGLMRGTCSKRTANLDKSLMYFVPLVLLPLSCCRLCQGFSELIQGLDSREGLGHNLICQLQDTKKNKISKGASI